MLEGKRKGTFAWAVVLVTVVIVGMWLARTGSRGAESLRPAAIPRPAGSEQPVELSAVEGSFAPDDRLSVESGEPARAAPAQEDAGERIDRYEQSAMRIRVTDTRGTPVSQALVRATGLRTTKDPGSWYGYGAGIRDETDSAGIAELSHPVWNTGIGGEWSDVSKLCFTVEHSSYVTQDVEGVVTLDEIVVVLQQGAVLVVSGWIEDTAAIVHDVRPRLNYQIELTSDDWVPLRDGRLSCNKIPPGDHIVSLLHERDGVPYTSAGREFSLAVGEQVELHLRLFPPHTLRGTLDESVPRPIENGVVTVAVQSGAQERGAVLMHNFSAAVDPDGSFEVVDLPPGEIEIIAFCMGWSSVRPPRADRPDLRENQVVPPDHEGDFVLRMQPTSRLRVTVLGPSGELLEGAVVQMWPNVHWKTGFAGFFAIGRDDIGLAMGSRRWLNHTDAAGVALLENLPAEDSASLNIRIQSLVLPAATPPWGGSPRRGAWVDLVSGETATIRVQLQQGED